MGEELWHHCRTAQGGLLRTTMVSRGYRPRRRRIAPTPRPTLHVLAAPEHHPPLAAWSAGVRAALRPELAERLQEAEFLWRSSRADFLLPAGPRATLVEELDDIDHLDDDAYVTSALITTRGSSRLRVRFRSSAPCRSPRQTTLGLFVVWIISWPTGYHRN
jgi:Family of unknown function (DUF5937)